VDSAYDPVAWRELYAMLGGAAAVVMGLIFVGVSIHLGPVLQDPWLRGRAESSLLALMVVLLISAAVLVPGQPREALGVEIAGLAVVSPAYSVRALSHLASGLRRSPYEIGIGLVGALLGMLGGLSLIVEWGGGLFLLLPGGAIAFASSVWNGWRLMVDIGKGRDA
jgi:hypothetical protein